MRFKHTCWYAECPEEATFMLTSFRHELQHTSCYHHTVEGIKDLEARDRCAVKVNTLGAKYR